MPSNLKQLAFDALAAKQAQFLQDEMAIQKKRQTQTKTLIKLFFGKLSDDYFTPVHECAESNRKKGEVYLCDFDHLIFNSLDGGHALVIRDDRIQPSQSPGIEIHQISEIAEYILACEQKLEEEVIDVD